MTVRVSRFAALFAIGCCNLTAQVLVNENWNSGSINAAQWLVTNATSIRLVNLGSGDYALAMGTPGAWGHHIYSQSAYSRGQNLRCTFKVWRDATNAQIGFHGPFHQNKTDPVYANLEAGVDYVVSSLRWGEAIPPNTIQSGVVLTGLTQAVANTNAKANAVIIRVILGDTQGALLEYSTNQGATFSVAQDTRGTGPSNSANVYLGFGPFDGQGGVTLIDDLVLERGALPTPTPSPTPTPTPTATPTPGPGIRSLSNFFDDPNGSTQPWSFTPTANIAELNLREQQGYLMVFEAGNGQEIKGLLPAPIKLTDYPLPWEFQLALMPNFDVTTGRSPEQVNTAMGLNIGVTFANPATWPADRNTPPSDFKSFQLFNVHLGNYAEVGNGLPQLVTNPNIYRMPADTSPEAYLMYGRGSLGQGNPQQVNGDWKIPYLWIGDGAKYAGPAASHIYFRCQVLNDRTLAVGCKFDMSHGWNMRTIDTSRFGRITGIWEVGPIFAVGNYIPNTLAPALGISAPPAVATPNPAFEYYVDYCAFLPAPPIPLPDYSDEFNIPGWMGQWQTQEQATIAETWSEPGRLSLTLIGPGLGTGVGPVGAPEFDLTSRYPPPWEVEWCLYPPDDSKPWNFEWVVVAYSPDRSQYVIWKPGVENDPAIGPRYVNGVGGSPFNLVFPNLPQSILRSRPLYMLIQIIDRTHLRVGFRATPQAPWTFSDIYDVTGVLPPGIGLFQLGVFSTETGRRWLGHGASAWQRLQIDYVRYRYGQTQNPQNSGASQWWMLK